MSNLNPGGSRAKGPRVFTAEGVGRVCRQAKIADVDKAKGSIATGEHKHSREVQRRLRQAAAKAARACERLPEHLRWKGEGPPPAHWYVGSTKVYRSYADYCDD